MKGAAAEEKLRPTVALLSRLATVAAVGSDYPGPFACILNAEAMFRYCQFEWHEALVQGPRSSSAGSRGEIQAGGHRAQGATAVLREHV